MSEKCRPKAIQPKDEETHWQRFKSQAIGTIQNQPKVGTAPLQRYTTAETAGKKTANNGRKCGSFCHREPFTQLLSSVPGWFWVPASIGPAGGGEGMGGQLIKIAYNHIAAIVHTPQSTRGGQNGP